MTSRNKGLAYRLSDEQFKTIILESISCADAMRKLGFRCITGNARTAIKRRISELQLDISHWANYNKSVNLAIRQTNELYFQKGIARNSYHTRARLIADALIPYKCAICGNIGQWNGAKLTLQIDHINGDHLDNRIENLRFLCPNCHSQTTTFGSKNIKQY